MRTIRYHDGVVSWRERNHYFFEWGQHNVENKVCRSIDLDGLDRDRKDRLLAQGARQTPICDQRDSERRFSGEQAQLANGDIVGFITQRPNLDYFHVGFVAFDGGGELLLRHASQSRHRVLDERMDRFVAVNRVRYVTLLRPQEPRAVAAND